MWVILLPILGFAISVSSESCYMERCLGCRPQEVGSLTSVECDPSNWVDAGWVHSLVSHPPPSTGSRVPIEYRCLKMVATPDDKSYGNTVDIIRGCVPRLQIDSLCLSLVAVERSRGHSDARCYTCRGNNCNAAHTAHAHTAAAMTLSVAILYLIYR